MKKNAKKLPPPIHFVNFFGVGWGAASEEWWGLVQELIFAFLRINPPPDERANLSLRDRSEETKRSLNLIINKIAVWTIKVNGEIILID